MTFAITGGLPWQRCADFSQRPNYCQCFISACMFKNNFSNKSLHLHHNGFPGFGVSHCLLRVELEPPNVPAMTVIVKHSQRGKPQLGRFQEEFVLGFRHGGIVGDQYLQCTKFLLQNRLDAMADDISRLIYNSNQLSRFQRQETYFPSRSWDCGNFSRKAT